MTSAAEHIKCCILRKVNTRIQLQREIQIGASFQKNLEQKFRKKHEFE